MDAATRSPPDQLLVSLSLSGNRKRQSHHERTTVPDVWVAAVAAAALTTVGPAPAPLAPPLPAPADLSHWGEKRESASSPDVSAEARVNICLGGEEMRHCAFYFLISLFPGVSSFLQPSYTPTLATMGTQLSIGGARARRAPISPWGTRLAVGCAELSRTTLWEL